MFYLASVPAPSAVAAIAEAAALAATESPMKKHLKWKMQQQTTGVPSMSFLTLPTVRKKKLESFLSVVLNRFSSFVSSRKKELGCDVDWFSPIGARVRERVVSAFSIFGGGVYGLFPGNEISRVPCSFMVFKNVFGGDSFYLLRADAVN